MNRITGYYARLYETARKNHDDERKFWGDVDADFKKRNVSPRDFSIRGLFEKFVRDGHGDACGAELIESWKPDGGYSLAHLEEAGMGAVTTGAFSNITGQIVYNEILAAWQNPAFIATRLARTVSTSFLDGEKIAGISSVGDDAEAVGEAQPYPLTGITEAYIETPRPVKRGHILPLTRETIISDRTNVLLDRAETISITMAMNKEKRVLDTVLGVTTSYKRNGATAIGTYQTATPFINKKTSNGLTDYTDIENALLLFDGMTDPETGEPIVVTATQILVPSALLYTARRIANATEVRMLTATTGAPETISPNPLRSPNLHGVNAGNPFEILSSPYVYSRGSSTSTWYVGEFQRAFRYMEVWPMSATQLPANSQWEFQNDIVRAWKVSEFGVPAVIEPRYVVQNTA